MRHAVNVEEMSSSPQPRSHPPLMWCRHKSQGSLCRGPASSIRQGPSLGNKWEGNTHTHTHKHTRAVPESHQSGGEKTSVKPNPPFSFAVLSRQERNTYAKTRSTPNDAQAEGPLRSAISPVSIAVCSDWPEGRRFH